MRSRLWTAFAVALHALEVARRGVDTAGAAAASQRDIVGSPPPPPPPATFLTVRAQIASSLGGDGFVDRGQDVTLSCLVTFPQMFALYEPYMMRWYRRRLSNAAAYARLSAKEAAEIHSHGVPAADWPVSGADILSSNGRLLADGRKYKLCYRRPHRFGFVLNYTLIIRGFAGSDEGEYVCEGVDNPDDPSWTLNARVSTQPLTLLVNEALERRQPPDSRGASAAAMAKADSTRASNVSSCTAAGFTYQILSTNCIYYSERNITSDFAVLLPCPIGTSFDLTKCRCIEGAVCAHG